MPPKILPGANDNEKLLALCALTYKEQAVWFLNAFWEDFAEKEAELFWQYVEKCGELDDQNHEQGNGLDELKAHVFLEAFNETLTVRALRTKLRETGAIGQSERPKLVPLTHYLLFKYKVSWNTLVNASQGDNSKELQEAQEKLDEVIAAFKESEARSNEAKQALAEATRAANAAEAAANEAKAREEEAIQKENEAKELEAPFKKAQEELEAALAEVKAQEDEYKGKIADCERRSQEGGIVQKNKAKNELAQLLAEDPLPLRKAKITLEAATKRAEKTRAPFKAATDLAVAARNEATAAREASEAAAAEAAKAKQASEDAAAAAEAAVEAAREKVAEAEAFLEEVKNKPGCAYGAIWWMERELFEQKKYLPEAKGGIRK